MVAKILSELLKNAWKLLVAIKHFADESPRADHRNLILREKVLPERLANGLPDGAHPVVYRFQSVP